MNIIDSCETPEQADVAENCVFNFLKNYNGAKQYMAELLRILEHKQDELLFLDGDINMFV
jgi:uncharacterized membrane protein SirB2